MGTQITNKIVTRGFGVMRAVPNRAGPVTMGYAQLDAVVEPGVSLEHRRIVGQSGAKRRLRDLEETLTIWARLVEVNDNPPPQKIEGFVRVNVNDNRHVRVVIEHALTRARKTWETIRVIASWVRR